MQYLTCPDATPTLFGLFDPSIAPTLLFYSYIPIALISLFLGVFIFLKDRKSLQTRLFLLLSVLFALHITNEIVQWIGVNTYTVMLGWQLSAFFQVAIVITAVYFVSSFLLNGDIPFKAKLGLFALGLPVLAFLSTPTNMASFDLSQCQANNGPLWSYIYILEIALTLVLAIVCFNSYRAAERGNKKKILLLSIGSIVFLGAFIMTNIVGDVTFVYQFNLFGPLGMICFIGFLSIIIVKYKAFNIKLIGAQALVFTIVFLVGSEFFFIRSNINRILTAVTVLLLVIFGYQLILSVKREIEQREKIQKLASELKEANDELDAKNIRLQELDKQKTEFVSFATHQLRSPLTAIKGNTSLILEGDAGPISESVKNIVQTVYISVKTMITVVEDYLNISRIELGTMKYDLRDLDFKDLLQEVVNEQKPNIESKGLTYSVSFDPNIVYKIKADPDKFKQVVMNTIDNSIKYTPSGSLTISLEKDQTKGAVRLKVADTGVGIRADVMPKLFQKFTRAPNASEANIHGTGLGLFIAKNIMDAHGGRVWAESAGEGRGSQFYIELPEAK